MSSCDEIFRRNCREILEHGHSDAHLKVRPRWEDGTPAHTIKRFGIINRYDLQQEFPLLTLRKLDYRAAIAEILWVWQKKYQLSQKHQYP